jgi:hypothetical protein
MAKPQQDKRASKRVKGASAVTVKVVDGRAHDSQAQLRDVSMRGVFIYLQNRVAVGSTLEVVLPLPESLATDHHNWIRCFCRVVRVEEAKGRDYGVAAVIERFEPLEKAQFPRA